MFNPVALYRHLLPTVYLFMADITNPDFLCVVVGPEFVSTSPALMRSSASHPACPHDRLAPKNGKSGPIAGVRGFDTIWTAVRNCRDSCTACRLCHLEPLNSSLYVHWILLFIISCLIFNYMIHYNVWNDRQQIMWVSANYCGMVDLADWIGLTD